MFTFLIFFFYEQGEYIALLKIQKLLVYQGISSKEVLCHFAGILGLFNMRDSGVSWKSKA